MNKQDPRLLELLHQTVHCVMHVWYSDGRKVDYWIDGGFLYSKERGTIECCARRFDDESVSGVLVLPLDQVDNITMNLDDRYLNSL